MISCICFIHVGRRKMNVGTRSGQWEGRVRYFQILKARDEIVSRCLPSRYHLHRCLKLARTMIRNKEMLSDHEMSIKKVNCPKLP